MNERQKNKSMVNAFGTGKPPVATVRRRGETRQQQRARGQGVDPNSDISAIFDGMQQMRTKVHKGMSGMPLNPDGTDPGNSFDRFMRQNPHLQGAAQRQAQYDQQARGNAASAVAERKALQGMDMLFPGKSSPPGGGQGDRVGSSNPSGGETLFGRMPNVQGEGMPIGMPKARISRQPGIQYGPRQPVQQTGWDALFPGKQVNNQMEPNAGPNESMHPNEGPQLQYGKPEQLQALRKIQGFAGGGFGRTAPTLVAAVNMGLSDMFPGVKDWEYLQGLFPGLVSPQNGGMQNTKNILDLLNNPAYLSQLNR